jgi:TRAP-type C4-dicarboxylate transport system permease small subunit
VLSALFAAAIAYYGWRAFGRSVAQGEFASGIVQFALWPARLALALGASLMVVASLGRVADALRGRAGPVHSGGAGH